MKARPLGHPRLHLRRTDSTNERARALALAGAPHGTLVTAAEQTAGRGRQGRRWSAPAGSALLMSLLLRWPKRGCSPKASVSRLRSPPLLPLIGAVAVCDVVGNDDARVKWPNDVVFDRGGRLAKLAGILIEGRPQEGWAVLGIGLNVAVRVEELPEELRDTAASLGLLERGDRAAAGAAARGAPAASRRAVGRGPRRVARTRRAARAGDLVGRGARARRGIDGEGRLIVALATGGHTTLDAGEVHLGVGD